MSDDEPPRVLRIETEIDRETIARRQQRRARRPARRSDRWWAVGVGVLSIIGHFTIGPSWVWWVGVAAAGLFLWGDLSERRERERDLAAIPPEERRRIFEIGPSTVRVSTAAGRPLVDATWAEVDEVRRDRDIYTIVVDERLYEIPLDAFPSDFARGSFEATAAGNDRPVRRD